MANSELHRASNSPPKSHDCKPDLAARKARSILLCVDSGGATSEAAARFALRRLLRVGDSLHVATVGEPGVWAEESLKAALKQGDMDQELFTCVGRILKPRAGGVSEAGAAIERYAKTIAADLVVVGSRGLGALQRGSMALQGLGSVSEYCINHMPCPVAVVKPRAAEAVTAVAPRSQGGARVCLAVDGTEPTRCMLRWAARVLIRPADAVHVITVGCQQEALMDPPADLGSGRPSQAAATVQLAKEILMSCGVRPAALTGAVLTRSRHIAIGTVISDYVNHLGFSYAVVGNRCQKGLHRFASSVLLGTESASLGTMHHIDCPVFIHRQPTTAQEEEFDRIGCDRATSRR